MAELNSQFAVAYVPTSLTMLGLVMCRYIGAGYGDPDLPFVAGTNEWYLLTEDVVSVTISNYTAEIPKGSYKLMYNDSVGGWLTLDPYDNVWHGSRDIQRHIEDLDADMRHDTEAVAIPVADQGRLGLTLDVALDNITGATWDKDTDNNLKGHLDDTTGAHAASAISCTVGLLTDVESVLDDHEARITALETGNAVAITGIGDFSGDVGVVIKWNPQDVEGIEYFFRYLWKHSYESVPALYTDLMHERRQGSPESDVLYDTRRFDIAINTDNDLVLYYAIGAKGGADASPIWTDVQNIGVVIPKYKQEQILTMTDVSWAQVSPADDKDRESIDSDEMFPQCTSEVGGVPADTNYVEWVSPFDNVSIKGIALFSGTDLITDATIKYHSTTGGVAGSFTVAQATRRGNSGAITVAVNVGDALRIWSMNPQGIGHYKIQVKYEVL